MQFDRHELDNRKSPLPSRRIRIHRLNEQQHFHYPFVEIGPVEVNVLRIESIDDQPQCLFRVHCNGSSWEFFRPFDEIAKFDAQLHRCVFERRFSKLEELDFLHDANMAQVESAMKQYSARLSQLTGSLMTCYPVLKFLELDCRGNHFEPAEETAINVPAVAAAVVTKEFQPTDAGHLMLQVGDILSIIEMNGTVQSGENYWKAKRTITANRDGDERLGLEIGYFPSDCVRLIDDKELPSPFVSRRKLSAGKTVTEMVRKRVQRKRPVFGVDLVEHLQRTGRDVPLIVERCCEAIEQLGIVTGIYRQCGIVSNIRKLRSKFDSGQEPDLLEFGSRDIYSVSSLLKQYFRQLPKPLFSSEAHSSIIKSFEVIDHDQGVNLRKALALLPPAHYRCAKYLMSHLNRLCEHTNLTDMTAKNLAIVWAPNLFRAPSRSDNESHLLTGLNVHTAVCHYLISHANDVFTEETSGTQLASSSTTLPRQGTIPKSATVADIRAETESKWPSFFRGRSIEFWRFGGGRASSSAGNTPILNEKNEWKRSHSTDAAMHTSRSDSMFALMARGVDGLRGGMRNLRERARSLRPSPRRHMPLQSRFSYDFPSPTSQNHARLEGMQDSITVSTTTQYSEESSPPLHRNLPIIITHDPPSQEASSSAEPVREKRVVFSHSNGEDDEDDTVASWDRPLCERSSPVEEWSSDSRESPQLEMSRYDNVSPNGTLNRPHKNRLSTTYPASLLYEKLNIS